MSVISTAVGTPRHQVRRAGAFAAVGSGVLLTPVLPAALGFSTAVAAGISAAYFGAIAALALYVIDSGPLFELFARPGDREDSTLYGLAGFALAAAALAILAARFGLPDGAFVASVLLVGYGNLLQQIVALRSNDPFVAAAGFTAGGFTAAVAGWFLTGVLLGTHIPVSLLAFFGASGALAGALLRTALFERDDPLVMVSVAFLLWLFADLPLAPPLQRVAVGLGLALVLGYLSTALGIASVPGMLTGVLLSLLAVVLGGYGWFAVLIAFFAIGGLATKFRYEEKKERGIAEENEGARGSGNVLANSAVALFAVLLAAASPSSVGRELALFAYTGSVAAAMSDTLSSEIGGLYDTPRLITSLERVEPGTDGGVTWQGEGAGIAGAALVAAIATPFFDFGLPGIGVIVVAGVVGMTVDSLLGATIEGTYIGNKAVNFLATLAGALAAMALALFGGVV